MNPLAHRRISSGLGVVAWAFAALVGSVVAAESLELPRPRARARDIESREFSVEELARLRAGKLVVRPEQRTLGGLQLLGGMSWQLVDAPVQDVWRALTDVRVYPRFLPAVEEARLVESVGERRDLFIRHRMGFISASYFVHADFDAANMRVRFRLDRERPSSIREAWGELRVTPYLDARSVVSLVIMGDLGEGLMAGLVRSQAHEWMLRVPEQVQRYMQSTRR